MIPETQYGKTLLVKIIASIFIVGLLLQMLSAIRLDNQFCFYANKIYNIFANSLLTAKFISLQPPGA